MAEQTKRRRKGGRPAAKPEDRRTIRRRIWLSPLEYAEITAKAIALGIPVGAYIRLEATRASMPRPPVPTVNMEAWRELARLAANVNQYQAAINQRAATTWPPDLIPDLLEAIRQVRFSLFGINPDDADDPEDDPEDDADD